MNFLNIDIYKISRQQKRYCKPSSSITGLSIYLLNKKIPNVGCGGGIYVGEKLKDNGNIKSAHKLVTSHLRLVAKIALGYRGYGLPVNELISEVKHRFNASTKNGSR